MNHENIYYLMHQKDIVTTLSFDEITGNILSIGKMINPVVKCYHWEEVNLFSNDFKDEFSEFRFKDSISSENKYSCKQFQRKGNRTVKICTEHFFAGYFKITFR